MEKSTGFWETLGEVLGEIKVSPKSSEVLTILVSKVIVNGQILKTLGLIDQS